MEKERILIYQDDEKIKKIDQAYEAEKALFLNKTNNVVALFSEFDETYGETGTTTTKYLQLLETGPQAYIDAAIDKIKSELANAGITSPTVAEISTGPILNKGIGFVQAFNELQNYSGLPAAYPGIKFSLDNVEIANGLSKVKNEIDLEGLKDERARNYIDTETGHSLLAQAETLVNTLNGINNTLRANNIYNLTDLRDFSDFAEFIFPNEHNNSQFKVNSSSVYQYAQKIKGV